MPWPFKSRLTKTREAYQEKLLEAKTRVLESTTDYWDRFVDPREAFLDEHGEEWTPIGAGAKDGMSAKSKLRTPRDLERIRGRCRVVATENEFAINGHENRVSYVIGTGLQYELEVPEDEKVSDEVVQAANDFLDEILKANDWATREQEAVRRGDRDGEIFLRTFWPMENSELPVFRFVEPETIVTPKGESTSKADTWGIRTDPDDVETVFGYHVDGEGLVDASEIAHVKLNVDKNQKRGIPTFYPVLSNLMRAEKLLRNMSTVATIQAAIALIREHEGFTSDQVEDYRDDKDDFTITNKTTGRKNHFQRFGPGTIVDAPAGTKYQFPIAGVAAEKFVLVLQAELRAVASRLVMPEFMFTADASNANYASTMVAEGPAVKMFQRLQSFWRESFVTLLWGVIERAVALGFLSRETLKLRLTASLPSLTVRDEEKEGKTLGREQEAGVISKRTWAEKRGYDYDREQTRIDEERERSAEAFPGFIAPKADDDDDEGDGDEEE